MTGRLEEGQTGQKVPGAQWGTGLVADAFRRWYALTSHIHTFYF